jgi:LPXTG-motif cell wall-anchored protein
MFLRICAKIQASRPFKIRKIQKRKENHAMKKRILSLLLALVMVLSLIPTLAFAAGEDYSKVTVYFSLSDNGKYKNGTSGKTLAYVPVTVEYFDLDDYGLGKYTRADAGEQPTVLHLFIKMLEQEYLNSGKLTVGGDALTVSGGAGSMYMTQFWGHDQNLTYYVNHVYPIMSGSTGATADWIILKDGDVVDVAMFDDWSFWSDAYAGFQYFMDGDAPTHSYTATAGEAKVITCKTAQTNMMSPSGTQYNVCGTQTVYYGKTLFAGDAKSVTTDSNGAASITFPEAGDWYVWANGAKGKSTTNVVSSPAYAAVTVEAGGGVTAPKLTLTMDKESVVWSQKVAVTATNEKDEPVVCNWKVSDPSVTLYSAKYSWDEQTSISIKGTEVKNGIVLTATSVDDPTLQAELRFDVLPLAEVYAVFGDGTKQPLTMKAETRAVGNGTFNVIEIPADADHIIVRPAAGFDISDGSGPNTNTPQWTPEYDSEGYCAVTRAEGDLEKTTYAPERITFNRAVLPKYPAAVWFCSRINVAKNAIYLAWELSTDNPIQEIKAENATLYTPVRLTQSSFRMLLDRNAETAAFLFATDAEKVYLTDEQYKTEGATLEQKDGFYVLPVKASDLEPNAKLPNLMEKTYYVVAESATGRKLRINVKVNQRDNAMDTPTAVEEYLCLASQYTDNANSVTGLYGTMPERTLAGYPQSGTGMGMIVSLGNFGGYITYRFDQLITNDPNHPYGVDFVVRGNNYGTNDFSFYEPANVLVSQDGKTWYTLAGSDHYSNHAYWDYTITYTKSTGTSTVYGGASGTAADWTDSMGYSGTSYLYPNKALYPLFPWTAENDTSITVTGTLLGGEGTTREEIFDVATPKWGYADTCYNGLNPYTGAEGGEVFDLDWAVDENGQPVKLDWVKYVKVQTASNVDGGSIGEKSTEVSAIYKTDAAAAPVGVTAAPASISINGQKLALKDGVDVYSAVADTAVEVAVDAPEGANVYINDVYGKSAKFDSLNHRMVRVVVQEGEKEPVIYYVNLKTQAQADEDAVADVIAKIDAIGKVTKDSGSDIKAARKAYDALSDAQKELVTNYQTLLDAEKSYKKLTRPTGGSSSSSTTDDKKNDGKDVKSGNTGDAGITLYLGMGLVAVMAGAVIVTRKRKEN